MDAGPKTLRFPDIVVDRVDARGRDLTAAGPALLVEVLSPSTATFDLGDKAAEFLRLADLIGYIVFAPDERKAWAWVRGSDGLPTAATVIESEHATIEIPSLGVRMPISDVYARIEFE